MSERPWTKPRHSHSANARPPTEQEQQDAEFLSEAVESLIIEMQTAGFSEREAIIFIAETAMEIGKASESKVWATKFGAIRAVHRLVTEDAAILGWGYELVDQARALIQSDL